VKGQASHQGAIDDAHKRRVRKEFERKVHAARRDPAVVATQDWSGVTAIVEAILAAFD
jgi:hypothetical protein